MSNFQLPLSGSQILEGKRDVAFRLIYTFNSLSRDHEPNDVYLHVFKPAPLLSTPSLGITSRRSSKRVFQRGMLSTPSLGITVTITVPTCVAYFILFQLPLSGSLAAFAPLTRPVPPMAFQLPLSGSHEDRAWDADRAVASLLSTPSLGITRLRRR